MRALTPIFVTLSLLSSVSQAAYSVQRTCKVVEANSNLVSIEAASASNGDLGHLVIDRSGMNVAFSAVGDDGKLTSLNDALDLLAGSTEDKAGRTLEAGELKTIALRSQAGTMSASLTALSGRTLFNDYRTGALTIETKQQNTYSYSLDVKNYMGGRVLNRTVRIDCQSEGFATQNEE